VMTNCMSLGAKIEFDNRRINALENIAEIMSKLLDTLCDKKKNHNELVEQLVGTANELDDLWKQEYKNANGRSDILMMINDSNRRDMDKLEQQKTLLEKRIKELEGGSNSGSFDLDEKHININAPHNLETKSLCKDTRGRTPPSVKSTDFTPRINKKNLKEVFKCSNYYSLEEARNLVAERLLRWRKRSIPELLNSQSTNEARLKKASNDLERMVSQVPKWLVIRVAIVKLMASKTEAEAALQQAALDRAALQERQEKEKRDQRRALENAKRVREDMRDAMSSFRNKRPAVAPPIFHANPLVFDEYDYSDGFAVKDHESEPAGSDSWSESEDESSDADIGALSDAVNGLDVGEAAVENLDG